LDFQRIVAGWDIEEKEKIAKKERKLERRAVWPGIANLMGRHSRLKAPKFQLVWPI
jgi:hypothetical protein